jgi:hypothetical protein
MTFDDLVDDRKKLHQLSVVTGAAAILAVEHLYSDPGAILYAAGFAVGSGVVGLAMEGVRYIRQQIREA